MKKRWSSTSFFDDSLVSLKVDDSWPTSHTLVSLLVTGLTTACSGYVLVTLVFNYAQI